MRIVVQSLQNPFDNSKYQMTASMMCKGANRTSLLLFALMVMGLLESRCNYLYISMSPQLYIPGQRYSLLTFYSNVDAIESKQFDISITFQLNQTTQKDQTNTIFDFISCSHNESVQCLECYVKNYDCLNDRYAKSEPCLQICNYSGLSSFRNLTLLPSLFINLTQNRGENNSTYIIDNTFFPCKNGAYQPELYLAELINIQIQENSSYGVMIKIIFVLLLQAMMIIIAYLVIMFRKYRKLKKKLEFLKGQEEAQDLLNSFLVNNPNTGSGNSGSGPNLGK